MSMPPPKVRGQQTDRLRRIGVIMNYAEADPEAQKRFSTLKETLRQKGWNEGGNLAIDVRWSGGKQDLMQSSVTELVRQPVEIVVLNSTPLLALAKPLTGSIPIVFTQVADPVGSGFLTNYSRPGGNITGFTDYDASIGGKWVELLKEAIPALDRVTVLLAPDQKNHPAFLRSIEAAASVSKLQVTSAEIRGSGDIERAMAALSGQPRSGLIVLPGPRANTQRGLIIELAVRLRLPTIYPFKYYAKEGGLLYYGAEQVDQWAKAADYVDRILKGERPGDLPVQAPTKFELIVNAKTAKAIGLTLPPTLLTTADEVIE